MTTTGAFRQTGKSSPGTLRREAVRILSKYDSPLGCCQACSLSTRGRNISNLAWLRDLMDRTEPGSFAAGVLLYTGHHALKLGDRLYLLPIDRLWA